MNESNIGLEKLVDEIIEYDNLGVDKLGIVASKPSRYDVKKEILSKTEEKVVDEILDFITTNYEHLKYKIIRNQPPKKLDVVFKDDILKGTYIKIRNIRLLENNKVDFKCEFDIHFFDVKKYKLTEEQIKKADNFISLITKKIITMAYIKFVK